MFTPPAFLCSRIRKWLKDNERTYNFDIFGYGVGGYSNMKLFLEMAKDLGLYKVGVLYDSGVDANKHFKEDKEKYPDYCFKKLPTTDIRDKYVREHPKQCINCEHNNCQKEGVFDSSGKLKAKYEGHMNSIMQNFIEYFKE